MKGGADGAELVRLLEAGLRSLETQVDELNRINVFPVPDGDTGTNMFHTLKSTLERLSLSSASSLDRAVAAIEENALYAARGNSGVILAAFLRGLCDSLSGKEAATAGDLAEAFQEGALEARAAVDQPVEGTVLTVMAEAAAAGRAAVASTDGLSELLGEMAVAAERSVIETPRLLPVLRNAGVLDAGAAGFLAILRGMASLGESPGVPPGGVLSSGANTSSAGEGRSPAGDGPASQYGYCTELMVESGDLDRMALRKELARLGDSLLVIGTKRLLRIHVHSADPGKVISVCLKYGALHEISIRNMDDQAARRREDSPGLAAQPQEAGPTVVAVVDGGGFAEIFRSLGAQVIELSEGPAALLDRAQRLATDTVVVLPNREDRLLGFLRLGDRFDGKIRVAETRNMGEGVAALFEWDPERSIDETLERMNRAASEIVTVEVDRRGGEYLARIGGQQVGPFRSVGELARPLVERCGRRLELCTVYSGDSADRETTEGLAAALQAAFPNTRIEVHYGGQSEPLILVSLE